MTTPQMKPIIQHLRRAALAQYGSGMTDAQILEAFIAAHDEAAFEALLRRHGPMVLGVCYRILRDHHAVEDAFQATFLVFAQKASSVRPRDRIANWLHGVALRTALKARTMRAKTRVRESQVSHMPEPQAAPNDHWEDVQPVLDEELARLPEVYRLPVLLCDVEGKSIKDATRQLGWPQGTLAGRLARARKMLAKRLTQRGVVLSAGSLAAVLSTRAASACVSPALAGATVKAAVAIAAGKTVASGAVSANVATLMKGVMTTMMLSKLKTATAVLLVLGTIVFGGGLLVQERAAGQQSAAQLEGAKPPSRKVAVPIPDGFYMVQIREIGEGDVVYRFPIGGGYGQITVLNAIAATKLPSSKVGQMDVCLVRPRLRSEPEKLKIDWTGITRGATSTNYVLQAGDLLVLHLADGSEAWQTENEKAHTVIYPVAELVVPIRGLDNPLALNKKEIDRTKEDWLIDRIKRTVSPASWQESGGTGTVQYHPLKLSLVVSNTPRVQAQVKYLLETMRRVQEVEVAAETRIMLLNAACFRKLQQLLPQLKQDGHAVLNDAETFALLRKAQDDVTTNVMQAPKITIFPGQRVGFAVDPIKDLPGIKRLDVKLNAMVAVNLQHIDLDVKATVGKTEFSAAMRLADGSTMAQVKRCGDDYLVLLVTPRVMLNLENATAAWHFLQ